jgi:tetratricopeptide (TPR) repeat protein
MSQSGSAEAAELTWIVENALPEVEGLDLSARELGNLPKGLTIDEIKRWCEAHSDCVGFAFWPWKGQWLPKRRGTGFIEETATWVQKKAPQHWQWFYLKERATASEGVSAKVSDDEPEEVDGKMLRGDLLTSGRARLARRRMLAGISHESLAEKYAELAGDGSQAPEAREAAMLFQAAETSLNDEQYEESLKASEDAVELFRKLGDGEGLADALRIVIGTHRARGEEDHNLEERELAVQKATDELAAFRQKGQRYGEAVMLLASAESTFGDFGHEKRDTALQSAMEARSIFKEVSSTKMEGIAVLCIANTLLQIGSQKYQKDKVEQAVETASQALPLFQQCKSQSGEAKALHAVAVAHSVLEAYEDAISNAKEALSVFRELGMKRYEGFEYYCIAQYNMSTGKFQDALQMGERAMTIMAEVEQKKGWEAAANETVIEAHLKLKDFASAERAAKDAVKQFARSKDRQDEASLLESLMLVYLAKDDRAEALRIAEKSLDAVQSMRKREDKNKVWEAYLLHTISTIHLLDESFDKANKASQDALRIMKEVGDPSDQAVVLNTITHVKCALQDYGDAARNGAKAREIFKEYGPRIGEAIALMSQSSALVGQGNIRRAVAVAVEAQNIFKAEEKRTQEAEVLEWLCQVYMMEGDHQKAITAAKKGKDIFREDGKLKEETLLTLRMAEASFMAAMEEGEIAKGGKITPAWEKAAKDAKDSLIMARKTTDDPTSRAACIRWPLWRCAPTQARHRRL